MKIHSTKHRRLFLTICASTILCVPLSKVVAAQDHSASFTAQSVMSVQEFLLPAMPDAANRRQATLLTSPRGYRIYKSQPSQTGPGIELTAVPRYGYFTTYSRVEGRVVNLDPTKYNEYRIGLLVHREGLGHYSKPYCTSLLSAIDSTGKFSIAAATGGRDDLVDHLIVMLFPANAPIYCIEGGDNISVYEQYAIARIDIERDDPRAKELTFSGMRFTVRNSITRVEPGQIVFSPDNVFVGADGLLHFRTSVVNTRRTGAEIISKNAYGRGRYIVEVVTSASSLPASTVFGAFTWGYHPANNHREGDIIELSRFGTLNGPTAGKGIQPDTQQNYRHFNLPPGCSRHEMVWETNRVRFLSYDCSGNLVDEFIYNGVQPIRGDEKFRLNIWSLDGSSDPDTEVIVKSVRFIPEPASTVMTFSSADYTNDHGLAGGSLATGFSAGNLATVTRAAEVTPLPTTLGGTTVKVRDSFGTERLAELQFVSPTQINYVIPSGLALGLADVMITNSNGVISTGTVRINRVSPGILTADSSGGGLPAAFLLRIRPDGTQVYSPVAMWDEAQMKFVPVPIELGSFPNDRTYLVLFATGLRYRQAISTVEVLIGGIRTTDPVIYAGAQGSFVGLDQLNLPFVFGLPVPGEQSLQLIVDGQVSNTVKLVFR